jgi:hypothetical protein
MAIAPPATTTSPSILLIVAAGAGASGSIATNGSYSLRESNHQPIDLVS